MVRSSLIISVFIMCALVLAGCTPRQSRDQYQQELTHAVEVRTEVSAALSSHTYSTAAAYDAASQKVVAAETQLDADKPPSGLSDAHQRMLDALDGLQALLSRLGRCEGLVASSQQDARACRQSISQDVYDQIRNDFAEADTIYRKEGFSLPGLGAAGGPSGSVHRGDVLDEPTGTNQG